MGFKKKTGTEAMLWFTHNMKEDQEADGTKILLPENTNYYYERTHIKRYRNCIADLMGIDGCARKLLDWLTDIMGVTNIVNNNKHTRDNFRLFVKEKTEKEYSDDAIIKAYKALSDKKFLIPYKRGLFVVNPEYFFCGQENDRAKVIRLTLEFKAGTRTEINIDAK